MRTLILVMVLLVGIDGHGPLVACGDKYLSIGIGTRYTRSPAERAAAAVLVYANAGSDLSRTFGALSVEAGMRKEGYRPTVVSTAGELSAALREHPWDVLVADIRDVPELGPHLPNNGAPHVVPVLTRPNRDDLKQARRTFLTVLDTPTKNRVFVAAVDDALDLHELEVKAAAKASKKASR